MNAAAKTRLRYDEGCLGAHALNAIGDRWALLVVRELMFAPKRFQMIRAGLPGITASVLTQRLGQLVQGGIVDHHEALGIYALTDLGRGLHPTLCELCRWALLLPGHDPTRHISISALMISISATVDRTRAAGSDLRVGIVSGVEQFCVSFDPDGAPKVKAVRDAQGDVILRGSGNDLAFAIYGPGPLAMAAAGRVALGGDHDAAQQFCGLFSLTPYTRSSSVSPEVSAQAPGLSST